MVLVGRLTFVRPGEGVHRSLLFTSSSLLLQQCLACLVRLTWLVSNIDSRTLVLVLLLLLVLGYYYASNIVLEESMMQISFGLTTPLPIVSFFFSEKNKIVNIFSSWDLRRVVA